MYIIYLMDQFMVYLNFVDFLWWISRWIYQFPWILLESIESIESFEDSRLQSINPSICMVTIWTFAEAGIGCWISPWSLVFFGEEFGLYLGFAYLYLPRVLPSLKLCMEVFVGSLLILKFALISLPFEGQKGPFCSGCVDVSLVSFQRSIYVIYYHPTQNPSKSSVHLTSNKNGGKITLPKIHPNPVSIKTSLFFGVFCFHHCLDTSWGLGPPRHIVDASCVDVKDPMVGITRWVTTGN